MEFTGLSVATLKLKKSVLCKEISLLNEWKQNEVLKLISSSIIILKSVIHVIIDDTVLMIQNDIFIY